MLEPNLEGKLTRIFHQNWGVAFFIKWGTLLLFSVVLIAALARLADPSLTPTDLALLVPSLLITFLALGAGANVYPHFKLQDDSLWVSFLLFFWLPIPWQKIRYLRKVRYWSLVLYEVGLGPGLPPLYYLFVAIYGPRRFGDFSPAFYITEHVDEYRNLLDILSLKANLKVEGED